VSKRDHLSVFAEQKPQRGSEPRPFVDRSRAEPLRSPTRVIAVTQRDALQLFLAAVVPVQSTPPMNVANPVSAKNPVTDAAQAAPDNALHAVAPSTP
jgi:hypothetical protein